MDSILAIAWSDSLSEVVNPQQDRTTTLELPSIWNLDLTCWQSFGVCAGGKGNREVLAWPGGSLHKEIINSNEAKP